ncbi:MAG TPA: hypothetical protein VKY74_07880, partial [Chloroflexia bacterium]|nr:hypothetical protein [Chloroflexia bacterium]
TAVPPTAVPPTAVPPTAVPPTPVPPTPVPGGCQITPSPDVTVVPLCGHPTSMFTISGHGFAPGEVVGFHLTGPDGKPPPGPTPQKTADGSGNVCCVSVHKSDGWQIGIWTVTLQGGSGRTVTGQFQVLP